MKKYFLFMMLLAVSFSYAVGNRSLVVKTPVALSNESYPQEGIVSFLLEEGIYYRLAVMPGWQVTRGSEANGSRLVLQTLMDFEGPVRQPEVRLKFTLWNEKNKAVYVTNIQSDIQYGLVDVINEVSTEVAKALGVDISERGILEVRVIPYYAVGGKIKIQGNVLGSVTNSDGFVEQYELVAGEEYEVLLEDRKGKGMLSNKVIVAKGEKKTLLFTPFNDRLIMAYGYAYSSPLNNKANEKGEAGFVDTVYYIFPRKWSLDYIMRINTIEIPCVEIFLGTGWYQSLFREILFARARFLVGIGTLNQTMHWNSMVTVGLMGRLGHFVFGGDWGIGYNYPQYFKQDNLFTTMQGWVGFYF
ncbi:MAG: hypothetical protein HPY78_01180 [Brevinematales bacterium]|nr:hypothetical protein [Brevinematales bacterium]